MSGSTRAGERLWSLQPSLSALPYVVYNVQHLETHSLSDKYVIAKRTILPCAISFALRTFRTGATELLAAPIPRPALIGLSISIVPLRFLLAFFPSPIINACSSSSRILCAAIDGRPLSIPSKTRRSSSRSRAKFRSDCSRRLSSMKRASSSMISSAVRLSSEAM